MQKPGWATFIGIILLLIGGCGAINDLGDINADKMLEFQAEFMDEIENEAFEDARDTIKAEDLDSSDQKIIEMFGDTIVRDSTDQVDVKETLQGIMKFSDYRIMWTQRFGYIGLFISILIAISGILFLSRRKPTIPFSITILAVSMAFGVFQYIIFSADSGTSNMIATATNFGIYGSIFIDMVLLITIMVLDKSYYGDQGIAEDYYDQ